jgi:hypothetical protein
MIVRVARFDPMPPEVEAAMLDNLRVLIPSPASVDTYEVVERG